MPEGEIQISRVTRSKEEARTSYDKMGRWYDIAGGGEKKLTDAGLQKLGVRKAETVLEIGFGTGHALVALAQAVGDSGKVYGIDISEGMLNVAREKLKTAGLAERVELRLGGLVAAFAQDQDPADALRLGICCGSGTAEKPGTGLFTRQGVNDLMNHVEIASLDG